MNVIMLLLGCSVIAVIGFSIMNRLDSFLEENQKRQEHEAAHEEKN